MEKWKLLINSNGMFNQHLLYFLFLSHIWGCWYVGLILALALLEGSHRVPGVEPGSVECKAGSYLVYYLSGLCDTIFYSVEGWLTVF